MKRSVQYNLSSQVRCIASALDETLRSSGDPAEAAIHWVSCAALKCSTGGGNVICLCCVELSPRRASPKAAGGRPPQDPWLCRHDCEVQLTEERQASQRVATSSSSTSSPQGGRQGGLATAVGGFRQGLPPNQSESEEGERRWSCTPQRASAGFQRRLVLKELACGSQLGCLQRHRCVV